MKEIYDKLIKGIQDYCEDTGCKGFCIGISGGKDSTVVAKLLVDALGSVKELGKRYYSKREINKKNDWFVFHVARAISALSIFLHSYNH